MISDYLQHGWSLIPVRARDKRPVGQWLDAQGSRASGQEVDAWIEEELNLAVVTGALSGVVVVDCDSEAGVVRAQKLGMPITPTATTGKGRHYFFAHPGKPVRNAVRLVEDVDVRGDGGYVLVSPSVHPNGQSYRWVDGLALGDVPLAECPAWLLEGSQAPQNGRTGGEWEAAFCRSVGSGERNQRCAELAGYLLRKWVEPDVVVELLRGWNARRCHPPMSEGEVGRTVMSIAKREAARRG